MKFFGKNDSQKSTNSDRSIDYSSKKMKKSEKNASTSSSLTSCGGGSINGGGGGLGSGGSSSSNNATSATKKSIGATAKSRCFALEQAYVHDVYTQIARECGACSPVRSHVKEFIFDEFEIGSLLLDIGCGDGKYLNLNKNIYTIGMEKCEDWFNKNSFTRLPNHNDILFGDLIYLPVRDEFFDGVLCSGVLHHLSTSDRRIKALKEMTRILKIGGKLLITVWAFEGRELNSQDVLIKWSSSRPKAESNNRHNSDSSASSETDDDTTSSCSTTLANYVNRKAAYESCNSPTSEFGTCYSFVRRALQRFNLATNHFYNNHNHDNNKFKFTNLSRRASKTLSTTKETTSSTSGFATLDDVPIELRNIDEENEFDTKEFTDNHLSNHSNQNGLSNHINNNYETFNGNKIFHAHNNHNNNSLFSFSKSADGSNGFFSIIKDHILPKQLKNNRGQIFTTNNNNNEKNLNGNLKLKTKFRKNDDDDDDDDELGFLKQRFSLPIINLRKKPEKMKHISLDEMNNCNRSNNSIDKEIEFKTMKLISEGKTDEAKNLCDIIENVQNQKTVTCKRKREIWSKILQKSLSSDSLDSKQSSSQRQQSSGTDITITTITSTLLTSTNTTGTTTTATTTSTDGSNTNSNLNSKLTAYYSMPELRLLSNSSFSLSSSLSINADEFLNSKLRLLRHRPKLTDLHPITFLQKKSIEKVQRNDSQDTQVAIEEIENTITTIAPPIPLPPPPPPPATTTTTVTTELFAGIKTTITSASFSSSLSLNKETSESRETLTNEYLTRERTNRLKEKLQLNLPVQQMLTKITEEREEQLKDSKKTQRSLSVEYKSRISPSNKAQLRRFSVSPSMLMPRNIVQFIQQETQHETHPSVDSEESFVTIIPANRSCRGSVDVSNGENDSYIDDVMMDIEQRSIVSTTEECDEVVEIGIEDVEVEEIEIQEVDDDDDKELDLDEDEINDVDEVDEDEDALCEILSNQQESDDNTSASIVTTKSLESVNSKIDDELSKASTPSPPANLHRYFHLFRCGELEEIIEKNINNLHVIKSYYSEHATSWCVVAEKVQVWTI